MAIAFSGIKVASFSFFAIKSSPPFEDKTGTSESSISNSIGAFCIEPDDPNNGRTIIEISVTNHKALKFFIFPPFFVFYLLIRLLRFWSFCKDLQGFGNLEGLLAVALLFNSIFFKIIFIIIQFLFCKFF